MRDVVMVVILGVFFPPLLAACVYAFVASLWNWIKRKKQRHDIVIKALILTYKVQVGCLLLGAPILGVTIGSTLGYAFPIVTILFSLVLGLVTFFYQIIEHAR